MTKFSDNKFSLTHFMPLFSIYTPWKHQKISGFFYLFGGLERNKRDEMGQINI